MNAFLHLFFFFCLNVGFNATSPLSIHPPQSFPSHRCTHPHPGLTWGRVKVAPHSWMSVRSVNGKNIPVHVNIQSSPPKPTHTHFFCYWCTFWAMAITPLKFLVNGFILRGTRIQTHASNLLTNAPYISSVEVQTSIVSHPYFFAENFERVWGENASALRTLNCQKILRMHTTVVILRLSALLSGPPVVPSSSPGYPFCS